METRSLSDSMIRDFTCMILQGLASVHNHGYVHCDLKPENIPVFPRPCGSNILYELKISDFGMSTKVGEESELWEFDSPFLGTPLYMSPEPVQNGIAKTALDL
ncbi:Mitogen-activated protein kinase kinase kinase 20 [Cardamine amara subsp. amara]|uniref:Mitogen-activated protein kinase kinase kinase 20 n=1 Tax=Cardamine amara subsp. amara TaxID=228776 RepID=A0ABD1B6M6_CARAN